MKHAGAFAAAIVGTCHDRSKSGEYAKGAGEMDDFEDNGIHDVLWLFDMIAGQR